MKFFFLTLIFFSSLTKLSAYTQKQLEILQTVRNVARTIPDKKGETYENTMSAICLVESSAGKYLIGDFREGVKVTRASLGILQVQVPTAKYVISKTPSLFYLKKYNDFQLANLLLTNIVVATKIATNYLVMLIESRPTYYNGVSGYNGGFRNIKYFNRVKTQLKRVYKLIKQNKLI